MPYLLQFGLSVYTLVSRLYANNASQVVLSDISAKNRSLFNNEGSYVNVKIPHTKNFHA